MSQPSRRFRLTTDCQYFAPSWCSYVLSNMSLNTRQGSRQKEEHKGEDIICAVSQNTSNCCHRLCFTLESSRGLFLVKEMQAGDGRFRERRNFLLEVLHHEGQGVVLASWLQRFLNAGRDRLSTGIFSWSTFQDLSEGRFSVLPRLFAAKRPFSAFFELYTALAL